MKTQKFSNSEGVNTTTKNKVDHNVLTWVFFASKGITDSVDLTRCQLLCMECLKENVTAKEVMESIGYMSCVNDIPDSMLTEKYIQEILNFSL